MDKALLPAGTEEGLAERLVKVYDRFKDAGPAITIEKDATLPEGVYRQVETPMNKVLKQEVMKAALRPYLDRAIEHRAELAKGAITTAAGFAPFDLRSPSLHLVPWLSPIRESLPRVARPNPGTAANWKSIIANNSSYQRGGLPAMGWVNQGQRAPQISLNTIPASATYATLGREGSVTFEAESSSMGFEDAIAAEHFFTLETVMVIEEDALLGGNNSLALGTANTPTGVISGSGSFTGTFYVGVIGLTYEGYRNFTSANGYAAKIGRASWRERVSTPV